MSNVQLENLYSQALDLEPVLRQVLAQRLLQSLPNQGNMEINELWREEVAQRLQEFRGGNVSPLLWEDVMANMEQMIEN